MKLKNSYTELPPPDVLLDKEILDRLLTEGWLFNARSSGRVRYVMLVRQRKTIQEITSLSRYIMDAPDDKLVDHINGNVRDNRLCNLRLATSSQNNANRARTKIRKRGDGKRYEVYSKYRGVTWSTRDKKWQANCKGSYLGRWDEEAMAAKAYDTQARKVYGEFSILNFPDSTEEVSLPHTLRGQKTGYRGVKKSGKRFVGRVAYKGKTYYTETFDEAKDAHTALTALVGTLGIAPEKNYEKDIRESGWKQKEQTLTEV